MSVYYNEFDKYAAQWLRNLIAAGHIAPGDVDERSIEDVRPADLDGYDQCHFFAGIGGWPLALRMAGWADDRPVWTGSCPCQPFSVASVAHGGAQGQGDQRHLWPTFFALVRKHRPARVFGEQVGSAIRWGWWDEAAMDLESAGYAAAAALLRADACGAEHERERLYWVADSDSKGPQGHQQARPQSWATQAVNSEYGNPLADARRALGGDYSGVLPGDGVPLVVERLATKGYGNAIVPAVAKAFIQAVEASRQMEDA